MPRNRMEWVFMATWMFCATLIITALLSGCAFVQIHTAISVRCTEDMACWDCETMGNKVCGTTSTTDPSCNLPGRVCAQKGK